MLERRPSGLLRFLLRLPLLLYRLGSGRLLGERFLLLQHKGRVTDVWHETVLEVVHQDRDRQSYVVAAAWGDQAEWLKNLRADPRAYVQVAGQSSAADAKELDPGAARQVLRDYIRDHALAARGLALLLGLPTLADPDAWDDLGERLPLVRFSPLNPPYRALLGPSLASLGTL